MRPPINTAPACAPVCNGPRGNVRRILLVEDSAVLSQRLVELLSEPGLLEVVAVAATQTEALEHLSQGSYEVLVVDIELAEGNGVAVIREAREVYRGDLQPLIVVLTNYASNFVREHCLAAGADYFLDKMRDISLLKPVVAGARTGSSARPSPEAVV